MSYDLETINQAWYIACEECMEGEPENMTNKAMLTCVALYCNRHAERLLRQAAKELNERQEA